MSPDVDDFPRLPPLVRCAIYTRQSRQSQSEFSSCDAQFEACLEFLDTQFSQGWMYCGRRYDDEAESSDTLDRPGLKRLWEDIEAGRVDRVIFHRLDRLSRNVLHCTSLLDELRRRGMPFTIVTSPEIGSTAADVFTLNLASSVAEFERELITERMSESRAALKRRGRRVAGVVPYGYTSDGVTSQLVPLRSEACRVQAMFARAAKGELALEIARHANRYGWRTKRIVNRETGEVRGGNRWTPRQVLATLRNPVYVGLIRVGDKTKPGIHQPLVSRELFDQVAEQITRRRSRRRPRSEGLSSPLRGLLICGKCGRPMSPSISHYGSRRYRHYRCRSHAGGRAPCQGVSLPAYQIESFVCQLLSESLPVDGETTEEIRTAFTQAWAELTEFDQTKRLPILIDRVVFDPDRETVKVLLSPESVARFAALK